MPPKLTAEQKEAMRQKLAAALAANDTPSIPDKADPASDNESAESDTAREHPNNSKESKQFATEIVQVNSKSESVEIANIRLFSIEELDLNSLANCRYLSLRKNLIHEFTPFPEHLATRLIELDLFDNKIRKIGDFFKEAAVVDETGALKPIVKPNLFSSLTKLDLSYNQIKKIAGLESLGPTLQELYLVENKIKTVQGLDALVNLELLELGGNRIREIGNGLSCLKKLKQLWLGKNKIADLSTSLNELPALELLSLQANRMVKLAPENFAEGANPALRELYLSENGLSTIEHLPIHHIHLLDMSFNPIAHINEEVVNVSNMPELEEFWLTDGRIDAWSEVDKFKGFSATLRTVYLERNPIEQDKRYRDKVYLALPFITQIDSWPVLNKDNLEQDRSIQRRNPRE